MLRLLVIGAVAAGVIFGQGVLDTAKRIEDARVLLDTYRGRQAHCSVFPTGPRFNFTLRLQAGYVAQVPRGQKWVVLTRITPQGKDKRPVYLSDVGQGAALAGHYWLGEGRYAVKWLAFDEQGDVCRKTWQIDARLKSTERKINSLLPPYTVAGASWEGGVPTARTRPVAGRLTILLHAASLQQGDALVGITAKGLLLDALLALMDEMPARFVRLVIFNLDQQKETWRKDGFTLQAMPEAAKALDEVPWAVDYRVLQNFSGRLDLIESLANQEIRASGPSDAVVFLGPHSMYSDKPSSSFALPSGAKQRFFYLMWGNTRGSRGSSSSAIPMQRPDDAGLPPISRGTPVQPGPLPSIRLNNGPDSIQYAVDQLGGKTLRVDTPDSFAKAVAEVTGAFGPR